MSFLPPSGGYRRPSLSGDDGPPEQPPEHPQQLPEEEPSQPVNEAPEEPRASVASVRRAVALTALGTVVPGAGLTLTRRRGLGIALLLLALAGLAALAWYVVQRGALTSALDLAARPDLLRTVGGALVVGGLLWMGSVALTALTARPRRMTGAQRIGLTAFTTVMCLVIAAPVALGLRYIDAHTRAVDRIFTTADGADGGSRPVEAGGPDIEQEDPWEGTERVNVLLLGSDAGWNREGVRTDSMIVASIDTQTGDTVLFSIPRNLQNVPIPADSPLRNAWPSGHYDCGTECLMNGIWTEAVALSEEHPEWFAGDPEPGRTATREVISEILGQPIHNTVIVNLDGFEQLVDAMGGVDINVQERVPIGGRTYTDEQGRAWLIEGSENGWIELGPQHLDGREALWYARSRVTTDDYSRMRRQRCVTAALVDQVDPVTMLRRYPQIVGAAGDNITVDVPRTELPAWAELVRRVQSASIKSLPFTLKNTDVADPNFAAIRLQVLRALEPSPEPTDPATETEGPPDDAAATTAEPTTAPTSDGPEAPAPTTDPSEQPDELADIGAVC